MRKSIAAAVVAAAAVTASCQQSHSDAGPTVSRNYQVGNFHQIEIAGPFDVTVQTGANPGVSAKGPQNLLDRTTVEVEGDKLVIRPKARNGVFNWNWSSHGKGGLEVTVPELRAVKVAGAGDFVVNAVRGGDFQAELTGAGTFGLGSIDVQSLKLAMAGAGDAKIGSGRAQNAAYNVIGAGDVDTSGVTSQQIKINVAGSGGVKAQATGTADINIMGTGDVDVSGGAKCQVSKVGPGDAHCS